MNGENQTHNYNNRPKENLNSIFYLRSIHPFIEVLRRTKLLPQKNSQNIKSDESPITNIKQRQGDHRRGDRRHEGWSLSIFALGFLLSVLPLKPLRGEVIVSVVGKVGDYFLTSREVIASRMIEMQLYPAKGQDLVTRVDSPEFSKLVTTAILEKVVALEADNFSVANVSEAEATEAVKKIKLNLAKNKVWESLALTAGELDEFVIRKMRSKKFLKYKSDAANLTVTNFEVKDYYEKNRYKFGNLPLDNFKENIRQFLSQKQMEDRLREWFEVLRKKYQVRNFLGEAG